MPRSLPNQPYEDVGARGTRLAQWGRGERYQPASVGQP